MSNPQSRSAGVFAALLAGALLSGCQSIELNANNAAQLRVIDASPDAGGIDAYQNSTALAYNLGFGTMTTYVPMLPGGYALSTAKAGTRQTLATANVQLAAGRQYTEIVGNVAGALQQTLYADQTQPAPAGEIAVRLIDQITHAGAVDVYLVAGSGKAIYTAPLATNLNFGSASAYLRVPAGTYAIVVAPAGSVPSASSTLLSGAQVNYAAGAVRTVVLIDSPIATLQTAAVEAIVAVDADREP